MSTLLWEIKDGRIVQLTHPSQLRLMELAAKIDLRTLSLRQIGRITGISNPQSVKYHIQQIAKHGFNFDIKPELVRGEQSK